MIVIIMMAVIAILYSEGTKSSRNCAAMERRLVWRISAVDRQRFIDEESKYL